MAATATREPVRLVVLNYNGGDMTLRCLRALQSLDWPADELELVVVDNASVDGSADAVAAQFPGVRLLRNPVNTGFVANNLALTDLAGVRYVGLVNNDAFVEPGWLRPLVDAMDADPGLGAVSSKMVFAPRFVDAVIDTPTFRPGPGDPRELGIMVQGVRVGGEDRWGDAQFGEGAWGLEQGRGGTFQWTAGRAVLRIPFDAADPPPHEAEVLVEAEAPKSVTFSSGEAEVTVEVGTTPRWVTVPLDGAPYDVIQNVGSIVLVDGSGADRGYLERDDGQYEEPVEVFNFCGGSVLFRPGFLTEVGLLDERFFLYYEDTDLSWRGRAQGWRYRYVPGSRLRHIHAATSGEGSPVFAYHVERNRLLMLAKNAPLRLFLIQAFRFTLSTASYARRDIVGPLRRGRRPNTVTVRRRIKAFLGFLRLLPAMLAERRVLRRRQTVPDRELATWWVRR